MRFVLGAIVFVAFATSAGATECRRVTTPTVLAVVAHGGVWTRTVSLGKTLSVRECGIRMFGKVYCQLNTNSEPPVYLQHGDSSGKEYTAFWGKSCR